MSILQQNSTVETVASLQGNSIILYKSFPFRAKQTDENSLNNLEKGKNGQYNGYMSPATARTVKRFLGSWLLSLEANMNRSSEKTKNKYYPTFVTLTLPSIQQHTDNIIKRDFLNRLIIKLKRSAGVKYYFWRAEPQENGNIHFHLLVDRWIDWKWLRDSWNTIIGEYGYIDAYRKNQLDWHKAGFKMRSYSGDNKKAREAQEKAYKKGMLENWQNPNTTDVHKLDSIENIAAYVVKYVTKKPDIECSKQYPDERGNVDCVATRAIEGRIWGCSDEIRDLTNYKDTYAIDEGMNTHSNAEIFDYVAKVEQEVGAENVYQDEYIKVIRLKNKQEFYLQKHSSQLYYKYKSYYKEIYKSLYVSQQTEILV